MLIKKIPTSVEIGGKAYEINTDFRVMINFELLISNSTIKDTDKISKALALFYPQIPANISVALEKMLWFYKSGKDDEQCVKQKNTAPIYSYEYDSEYIYAAFLKEYGIDLQDISHFHWWKFKAMFISLPDDTEIKKIMGYRSVKINTKMSSEQQKFYSEMKKIFAIPASRDKRKKQEEIQRALLDGGDLNGVL